MSKECEKIFKFLGEIEIYKSYFKAKRVREKRGRGAANKPQCLTSLRSLLQAEGGC